MPLLNDNQKHRAIEVMQEYLNAPPGPQGKTPKQASTQGDVERVEVIEEQLKPMLDGYLAGEVPLDEFKSKIDSINKRHEQWGFKGIKGQMFFNMVVNVTDDMAECDSELKSALAMPANEDIARSRIKTFVSYVKRIGQQHVEAGGTKHGMPKFRSALFFLSYFWQIHDRNVWPVYYTNSVNMMTDLNLWQAGEELAENYIHFKHIHEELGRVFTEASGEKFGLYEVEHVFWFKGGNPFGGTKPGKDNGNGTTVVVEPPLPKDETLSRLPDSYVPPVVAILPRMALHDVKLTEVAKASGTSLDRAFEKSINAAFTILGFDTTLLGQGQGRVPDGRAIDLDNAYAVLWDAKVRKDGYSMGTDDRTIREYITTQSRELKRKRSLRNIYYMIVSSGFKDDYDDTIRTLKMDTDINEVCLVEADALVAMVDAKLREPQQLTLGPDGLQRLFSASGVLKASTVRETLL